MLTLALPLKETGQIKGPQCPYNAHLGKTAKLQLAFVIFDRHMEHHHCRRKALPKSGKLGLELKLCLVFDLT